MMMNRHSLAPMAIVCSLMVHSAAFADEKADLEKGRNAYLTKQYAEADARFRLMLDPATGTLKSSELINEARMYWGAVYVAMKRTSDAQAVFSKVIRQDPEYQPDPLTFPTEVLDVFTDAKAALNDEIGAQKRQQAIDSANKRQRELEEKKKREDRIKLLERLASEETVIDTHSRWRALMPFGFGQFQNGRNTLGGFFLVSETTLSIAAAVTLGIYLVQVGQAADFFNSVGSQQTHANTLVYNQYIERANTTRIVNLSIAGTAAALMVAGVIEAQVNYVPDVTLVRPRTLPRAFLVPTLIEGWRGEVAGGALSVTGNF